MTKLFKKIKKVNKAIKEKITELTSTKDPLDGYFLKIGSEKERQQHIAEIQIELKTLYSNKYALLESLERLIHNEKVLISNKEKNLTLAINS